VEVLFGAVKGDQILGRVTTGDGGAKPAGLGLLDATSLQSMSQWFSPQYLQGLRGGLTKRAAVPASEGHNRDQWWLLQYLHIDFSPWNSPRSKDLFVGLDGTTGGTGWLA